MEKLSSMVLTPAFSASTSGALYLLEGHEKLFAHKILQLLRHGPAVYGIMFLVMCAYSPSKDKLE